MDFPILMQKAILGENSLSLLTLIRNSVYQNSTILLYLQ